MIGTPAPEDGSSAPRRRRPRRGDVAEQAILETAQQLLAERPLNAIGIDELAAGAGISRPSFYFYFESREAMLRVLAERVAEELYRAAELWLRRSGEDPEAALRRAVAGDLAVWRAHGAVLRAVIDTRPFDPAMREFWNEVGERFAVATAAQIEREREAGLALVEPPSARSLAAVLISMNDRAFYVATLGEPSAEADADLVDTLTRVWLRAVYGTDAPGQAS